jgi:Holliday junction resolvasome RuvABC endonuclease subunit
MPSIGVDYSAQEAYLALTDAYSEKVLHTVKLKLAGDLPEQRRAYLDNLTRMFASLIENFELNMVLWVEQPWVAGNHFPNTALKLVRNATYIEVAALAAGLDVRFVHVSTWRKAVFGNGKPQDPKGTAVAWVLYNLGFETKNHNSAEAACIGFYGDKYG